MKRRIEEFFWLDPGELDDIGAWLDAFSQLMFIILMLYLIWLGLN